MNADEVVRALHVLCGYDGKSCDGVCSNCPADQFRKNHPNGACDDGTMSAAFALIESLQSQLAEAKRRAEKALGYIKKIVGCDDCVHNDDTNYETCKSCNIYDKWQWRGDAEEGDAK